MFDKYLSADRVNRLVLLGTVILVIWKSIELLFTRIWAGMFPSIIAYAGEGLLVALAFIVAIHPDLGRKNLLKRLKNPLNISIFIFFAFAIASMFVNNVPFAQGVFGVRALFQYVILFYILLCLNIPEGWVKKLFYLIIGLALFQSILGVIQIIMGIPLPLRDISQRRSISIGEEIRAFGLMDSSNTLAGFLVAVLLLTSLYLFVYRQELSSKAKAIYMTIIIVILAAIALTFSRQAFLALIGCFGVLGIVFRQNKAFRVLLKVSVGLVVIFAVGYGLALAFLEGFAQRNFYTMDLSRNYRFLILISGLDVFMFNPIMGVGPGMFGSNAAFFFGSPFHQFLHEGLPSTMKTVDNNAFYVLVEYGVIGVILLGYFIFKVMKHLTIMSEMKSLKNRWIGLYLLAFTIAFIMMGFLSTSWENQQISLYFWLFLGIAMNWYNKEQANE